MKNFQGVLRRWPGEFCPPLFPPSRNEEHNVVLDCLLFAKMQGGTQNQSLSCFAPETSSKEKVLEGPHVLLLRQTVELGQRSAAGKFLFPFSLRNSVVAVVQAAQPCAPDDPAIQRRSHCD